MARSNHLSVNVCCGGLLLLAATASVGCQSDYAGQTLPSPYWQKDDIQYFPPGPEFKLSREAAAMRMYGTGRNSRAASAPLGPAEAGPTPGLNEDGADAAVVRPVPGNGAGTTGPATTGSAGRQWRGARRACRSRSVQSLVINCHNRGRPHAGSSAAVGSRERIESIKRCEGSRSPGRSVLRACPRRRRSLLIGAARTGACVPSLSDAFSTCRARTCVPL